MELDWQVCSRARLARDARFDGKFFIGVRSTKIYCRVICRTRTSKEKSVVYFPTAAAAEEAGFRPCLRCRPESSPGTPAWSGTRSTVSRALRLISESGLEDGGVEALAEKLGVGSRHLRRLFLRHLGATPSSVARTRRLHFAKKLIDETKLPMTQVALAAGFGCVRRFNAAIRDVYHRTPTQIRALARRMPVQPENQYVFQLSFRPPYNWKRLLEFLAAHATPEVEIVERDSYSRTISLNGSHGEFQVSLDPAHNALTARVQFGDSRALFSIIERIRAMFDLGADWDAIAQTLRADRDLARLLANEQGLRVAGCWDNFELIVLAILRQQLGDRNALTAAGRLVREFGQPFHGATSLTHLFPTAESIVRADLASAGLPNKTAAALHSFARAVRDRRIRAEAIADCDAYLAGLREIPGIEERTIQYVAMRALRDPDAFPIGDSSLLSTSGNFTPGELERRAETWRPWRAYAAMLLCQADEDATAELRGARERRVRAGWEAPPEDSVRLG